MNELTVVGSIFLGFWFMAMIGAVHARFDPWRIDGWIIAFVGGLGTSLTLWLAYDHSPWVIPCLYDTCISAMWIDTLRKKGGPPGGAA